LLGLAPPDRKHPASIRNPPFAGCVSAIGRRIRTIASAYPCPAASENRPGRR
jgi:hypothetical protein